MDAAPAAPVRQAERLVGLLVADRQQDRVARLLREAPEELRVRLAVVRQLALAEDRHAVRVRLARLEGRRPAVARVRRHHVELGAGLGGRGGGADVAGARADVGGRALLARRPERLLLGVADVVLFLAGVELGVVADPADASRVSLALAEREQRLVRIPARDRLLIVDAGFTGQGLRSLAARGVRPLTLVDPPSPIIRLVAASPGEPAGAAPNQGGLFTHYLVAALGQARGDGDGDGQITLAELQSWLTPRAQSAARTRGAAQTPSFTIDPRGPTRDDVVLGWGYPVL